MLMESSKSGLAEPMALIQTNFSHNAKHEIGRYSIRWVAAASLPFRQAFGATVFGCLVFG